MQSTIGGSIAAVSAGMDHSGVVNGAGELYVCGGGDFGKLGLGVSEFDTEPQVHVWKRVPLTFAVAEVARSTWVH